MFQKIPYKVRVGRLSSYIYSNNYSFGCHSKIKDLVILWQALELKYHEYVAVLCGIPVKENSSDI